MADEFKKLIDATGQTATELNNLFTDAIDDANTAWAAINADPPDYGTPQIVKDWANAYARSVNGWRLITKMWLG